MPGRPRPWLLAALFLLLFPLSASGQSLKALVGGTLIDGYGGDPLQDSVILIEGERIQAVGREGEVDIPADAEVISTEGMSVMPGLWDAHVHLMINGHADYAHWDSTYLDVQRSTIMPASASQLLHAGVTSVRELGAPLDDILAIRDSIDAGHLPGPTLYVSGPFLQDEPYPGTEAFRWGIDSPDDARAKVNRLAEAGVDLIKMIDQDQMSRESVHALVDAAHQHDLPVVAHAHRPQEILRGLEAGGSHFEHTGLSTAPAFPDSVIERLEERTAKMNLGPVFWTPTLTPLYNYEYLRDHPEQLDEPSWHRGLPDSIVADIRASIEDPATLPYYQLIPQRRPTVKRKFEQLREAGVVPLVGTDSGVPLFFHSQSTWQELDLWVRVFDVPPMQALRSATYWPAVMMGVEDEVGTIEPGHYADIIAVEGDVLRHISLLRDVDLVLKHGVRYK